MAALFIEKIGPLKLVGLRYDRRVFLHGVYPGAVPGRYLFVAGHQRVRRRLPEGRFRNVIPGSVRRRVGDIENGEVDVGHVSVVVQPLSGAQFRSIQEPEVVLFDQVQLVRSDKPPDIKILNVLYRIQEEVVIYDIRYLMQPGQQFYDPLGNLEYLLRNDEFGVLVIDRRLIYLVVPTIVDELGQLVVTADHDMEQTIDSEDNLGVVRSHQFA